MRVPRSGDGFGDQCALPTSLDSQSAGCGFEPHGAHRVSHVIEAWLDVHEGEETTLDTYRGYLERTIRPALGDIRRRKRWPSTTATKQAAR